MVVPEIKGHEDYHCPSYAFLISHGSRHLLFDIGCRKDIENLAPNVREDAQEWGKVEQEVADILAESALGIKPADIEAVIWSHHHWDHIGNMSAFPATTELVVGPGFKEAFLPGYPSDPEGQILEADYAGRSFREVDIAKQGHGLKIGRFQAYDYFGDGSFYILDTPGHAPGHVTGLARVTTSPDTFMLLAADACDHGGELRPTEYQPLPSHVTPSPCSKVSVCPGALLQQLQSDRSAVKPFYTPEPDFPDDFEAFVQSLDVLKEMDAHDDVLVVMAHDLSLKGVLSFFPDKANFWKRDNIKDRSRWLFLSDFRVALDELVIEDQ